MRGSGQLIAPSWCPADAGTRQKFEQATAAYAELRSPWGRTEAYADVREQAWRDGHFVVPKVIE